LTRQICRLVISDGIKLTTSVLDERKGVLLGSALIAFSNNTDNANQNSFATGA
jgi:hypothetical protein